MTGPQDQSQTNSSRRPRLSTGSLAAIGVTAVVLAALSVFPALDLGASKAFYVSGEGFPWRYTPVGAFFRHDVPVLLLGTLVICVAAWGLGRWRGRIVWGMTGRTIFYLLTTLIVGPGLIVETLLKPHSGRARPEDLTMFGGDAVYTPPLWPADACASNCAFVSGHAALAFWITAYAFIVPPAWRRPAIVAGVAVGLVVGTVRVMQGGHFPSDIAYAGVIVVAVNAILAKLILPLGETPMSPKPTRKTKVRGLVGRVARLMSGDGDSGPWLPQGKPYPRLLDLDPTAAGLVGQSGLYVCWHLGVRPRWIRAGGAFNLGGALSSLRQAEAVVAHDVHGGLYVAWALLPRPAVAAAAGALAAQLVPACQSLVLAGETPPVETDTVFPLPPGSGMRPA